MASRSLGLLCEFCANQWQALQAQLFAKSSELFHLYLSREDRSDQRKPTYIICAAINGLLIRWSRVRISHFLPVFVLSFLHLAQPLRLGFLHFGDRIARSPAVGMGGGNLPLCAAPSGVTRLREVGRGAPPGAARWGGVMAVQKNSPVAADAALTAQDHRISSSSCRTLPH